MRFAGCGCLVVLVLLGCGDDQPPPQREDAAAAPAHADDAPVDPQSRLVDLSGDEAGRVCRALSEQLDDRVSRPAYLAASCTQQAWPVSFDFSNITGELIGSPARCMELVKMCLDKGGALGDFTPTKSLGADLIDRVRCTLPAPELDLSACQATVGDLQACAAAAAAEIGPQLARTNCDALADPESLEQASKQVDISQLAACQGLLERCPIFTLDTLPDGRVPNARD